MTAESSVTQVVARWLEGERTLPAAITADTRLRIARAVTQPETRAVLLTETNVSGGHVTLEEAVRAHQSFFVKLRPTILGLDFDAGDAIARAHFAYSRLRMMGYAPLLLSSGQPGRRHVFCHVEPSARARLVTQLELRPNEVRTTIRPPLTPHRFSGLRRTEEGLLLPRDPNEAYQRLVASQRRRKLGEKALAAVTRQRLGTQPIDQSSPVAGDGTASEVVFAVAKGAANAGWTCDELLLLLSCSRFPVSGAFERRWAREGPDRTRRWLETGVWKKASEFVTSRPPRAVPSPRALMMVTWIARTPWPHRTGPTDRVVLLALAGKYLRSGRNPVDASIREICEIAGISGQATVEKSLSRLRKRGLIRTIVKERKAGAPLQRQSNSHQLEVPMEGTEPMTLSAADDLMVTLGADIFRNRIGLGKSVQSVWDCLRMWPGSTVEDVARRSGRSEKQVRSALRELRAAGLADIRGAHMWEPGLTTVEVAAKEIGASGRGDLQRLRFNLDRDAFNRFQQDR